MQVNRKRSEAFAIERSIRQSCLLSPLLYVLALEPLLRRQLDEGENPALRGVPFASCLRIRVSAGADDITVFVSCRLDIKTVKKMVLRYEGIAGAKINFDKSKGLRLGTWRGGIPLPGSFAGVTDPSASSRCVSGPASNWSEVGRKCRLR